MPRLLSRRSFLMTGAALGGTTLIAAVGGIGYLATVDTDGPEGYVDGHRAVFNAFVAIHDDGRVVVQVPRTEMGQGIHTGLAMLVAEELDVPFDGRVTVEFPVERLAVYANWSLPLDVRPEEARGPFAWLGQRALGLLPMISTGGSSSTMGLWHPMRVAGAAARKMLVEAAADRLILPPSELHTEGGFVRHAGSGVSIAYGDLAREAAMMPPPSEPQLKPASAWKLIGKSQRRVDLDDKVRGKPVFGTDVVLPGLLHAAIRHAPVFGAGVAHILNEAAVRGQPGVVDVAVVNDRSVAVVATSWWQAETAAGRLKVAWKSTEADRVTSTTITASLRSAFDGEEPYTHLEEGVVDQPLPPGVRTVEAVYEAPFVAHACMEPMNATVLVRGDSTAEAWCPHQSPMMMRWGVEKGAAWADVEPASITCHVTMNGGAFGRRNEQDVVSEATFLAARHPDRPVKLMWSREEDIGRGTFRNAASARLRAVLGPEGTTISYDALVATQSLLQSSTSRNAPLTASPDGDAFSVEGLAKSYYGIANQRVRSRHVPNHVPVGTFRATGYSFGTFFAESFIDECAVAAGKDPLDFRRGLLRRNPRHLAVLDSVAALSGWGRPLPPGRGRGIAFEAAYESVVAQVAEVTVADDGEVTVDRYFCSVDVGTVVNPDAVTAQMEGGIVFGLTTALASAITIDAGAVVESNFHDYPMLRMRNAPEITVEIMPSDLPPGGAGEIGNVPVAAAVANAIHAATGRRIRSLPLAVAEPTGERQVRLLLKSGAAPQA
jgi:isoquinoline 1-oxidoreductase beta subunit